MDKSRCVRGISGDALVLGGSGGLGAEIVRALAASGAAAAHCLFVLVVSTGGSYAVGQNFMVDGGYR